MTKFENFDQTDYAAFLQDTAYQDYASIYNAALYNAFINPIAMTTNQARCAALMQLLDNAYSAGLTRHSDKPDDYFGIWHICEKIFDDGDRQHRFAGIIEGAAGLDGILCEDNLKKVNQLVADLKTLISEVNGTGKEAFSFVPKFLHFISRSIPPWDGNACRALTKLRVGNGPQLRNHTNYTRGFLDLLIHIHDKTHFGCNEVKALDNYLQFRGEDIV